MQVRHHLRNFSILIHKVQNCWENMSISLRVITMTSIFMTFAIIMYTPLMNVEKRH